MRTVILLLEVSNEDLLSFLSANLRFVKSISLRFFCICCFSFTNLKKSVDFLFYLSSDTLLETVSVAVDDLVIEVREPVTSWECRNKIELCPLISIPLNIPAAKNRSISDSLLPSLTGFIATEKLRITAISR